MHPLLTQIVILKRHFNMLRRKSSGDDVALSATYAPVRPRRKRQEPRAAPINHGPLPQANAMFLVTVAALAPPPQQRPQVTSSRSILQKSRAVKPMASQPIELKHSSQRRGQVGNEPFEEELLGERDETPRRIYNTPSDMSLKDKLLQESGACIQEKLAYDELLRYQRSRAEDMVRLFGLSALTESDKAKQKQAIDFRRAAGFREEWRIGAFCLCIWLTTLTTHGFLKQMQSTALCVMMQAEKMRCWADCRRMQS